jgi:hypothetical protein
VKWINLVEGKEKWLAVVNVVMNIRALGDLLTVSETTSSSCSNKSTHPDPSKPVTNCRIPWYSTVRENERCAARTPALCSTVFEPT